MYIYKAHWQIKTNDMKFFVKYIIINTKDKLNYNS